MGKKKANQISKASINCAINLEKPILAIEKKIGKDSPDKSIKLKKEIENESGILSEYELLKIENI